MADEEKPSISASEFMRNYKPELYSDSEDRPQYRFDKATLEHQLDTVTTRNETHDFELFCRKLCEKSICPNLRPQTGPEGGGDGKADSETIPVADEISKLTYVGEANAGKEKWAFGFSAKKRWSEKVRSDVEGIVSTKRGYQKIFCVTSRPARAKDRARIEDELTKEHGIPVTILDRTWIVTQIIDNDLSALAFDYLHIGELDKATHLGPTDYSRKQDLENIERDIESPEAYQGIESQRVTEALVAAKLSRNMERPRIETEGRFARAIRLADSDGSQRQQFRARYENIWTLFWWYDDYSQVNKLYDEFEKLVIDTDHAANLEFLCNLLQTVYICAIHGHLPTAECKLPKRETKLVTALEKMSADRTRPNNSLEAETSLIVIRLNQAMMKKEGHSLEMVWDGFLKILERSKGLGEYSADRLIAMIEMAGNIAGDNDGYTKLVEMLAKYVSERTSEGEGGLILLRRAQKLSFNSHFEMIRLLGRAARQLTKKEHTEQLIEALQLLSLAYRRAGLLWAARASCIFAISSLTIVDEEEPPASIIPTLKIWAWVSLELGYLADYLNAVQTMRILSDKLPLSEESQEKVAKDLQELDACLAGYLINLPDFELSKIGHLPDVLESQLLFTARTAMLYALGYEEELRTDGSIPLKETSESAQELMTMLAAQPIRKQVPRFVVDSAASVQNYSTLVLGMKVSVRAPNSEFGVLLSEAILGSIEAIFATAFELKIHPHTEKFSVEVNLSSEFQEPSVETFIDDMKVVLNWPESRSPLDYDTQESTQRSFHELIGFLLAATCVIDKPKETLVSLYDNEKVHERVTMIMAAGNSHFRIFGRHFTTLGHWNAEGLREYAQQGVRPILDIDSVMLPTDDAESDDMASEDASGKPIFSNHKDVVIKSVIDMHQWDKAGWHGTLYVGGPGAPYPILAFLFKDRASGEMIFQKWRERFGTVDQSEEIYLSIIRGVSRSHPSHYKVMVTSAFPEEENSSSDQKFMVLCRFNQMTPDTDENLYRFLSDYQRAGRYLIMPAFYDENGSPELTPELAIGKIKLAVKNACDIGNTDIELTAIRSDDDIIASAS